MSTVIKVENLSKQYRLGNVGTGSLAHDLNRTWHRVRGKEDPYLKIGEANDRSVKGSSEYVWALQDINFEVKQGEVLGIIGRNGAGKSTLLKILSRTTTPTTGSIKIKGRVASLLEVGTGFHPELTGRENIFLNGAILGMTRQEIKSKFDEIVDFAGVERYIDTPVKRYSSGMYVRLAFGVAAHLEPEILIVDEVLAVGDAEFQKKALGKMKDVSTKDGRTVLFVSHNMSAIKNLCTKGTVLSSGGLTFLGDVSDAIAAYQNHYEKRDIGTTFRKECITDNDMELLEAEIFDNAGKVKSEYSISEDICLRVLINCKNRIPNLYGYITVKNMHDEVYIESDTYDFLPNVLDNMNIGINEYKLQINKYVLPVGKYKVYFNFTSHFANRFNIENPGDILSFQITDMETRRGFNRKSYTSQLLKWEIYNAK